MKNAFVAVVLSVSILAACGEDNPAPVAPQPSPKPYALVLPYKIDGLNYGYQGCTGDFQRVDAPVPGAVIKGSYPQMYYLATNGKRYVFPTVRELASWFGELSADGVPLQEEDASICSWAVEVADTIIDDIAIGGVVTLRPGTFVVGIAADPQRFVIGGKHNLHAVSFQVSQQIYGDTLAERTRLLPEAIFVNYALGGEVTDAEQYDAAAVRADWNIERDGLSPGL